MDPLRRLACGAALVLGCGEARQGPVSSAPAPAGVLEAAIELARRDHPDLDAAWVRGEIDRLARRFRERVGAATDGPARIAALRETLFDDARLESVSTLDSVEALHVDSVLRKRRGYCLSLSIVALAIAERAGLPLRGVAAPNHFLVRYDDGSTRSNLELTRRGEPISDEELRARAGDSWHEGSIYLRDLDVRELRAVLLHNRGFAALAAGRRSDALADLEAAARELPELPEAHRNLGVVLGEEERWVEARAAFDRALRLRPDDADALVNRAICLHALGDVRAALADLEIALAIDPSRESAKKLQRAWSGESGGLRRAERPLEEPPSGLKPGLLGLYHRGLALDSLVRERVDRDLDFEWKWGSPVPGVPSDRFSVRWRGWLRAPRGGTYSLFVIANDGARVSIGGHVVLEGSNGGEDWYGTTELRLQPGWHRLQVDHHDAHGGARLLVRLGVEGEKKPLRLADLLFHEEGA